MPIFPANAEAPRRRGVTGPCSCRRDAQQVTRIRWIISCPIDTVTLDRTNINTLVTLCAYPGYGFTPLLTHEAIALQDALQSCQRGRCWRHAYIGRRHPQTVDPGGEGLNMWRERLVAHGPNPPRRLTIPPSHQSIFSI